MVQTELRADDSDLPKLQYPLPSLFILTTAAAVAIVQPSKAEALVKEVVEKVNALK